jgi:uncharacterized integral membrane protein
MSQVRNAGNGWTTSMRWTARIVGLIAAGLFVAFLVVSGATVFSSFSWLSWQGLPLLIALVAAVAGALLAWRWELVGGAMTSIGALTIIGLVCLGSGGDMFLCSLFFTLPLLVAGALHLGCCARTRLVGV